VLGHGALGSLCRYLVNLTGRVALAASVALFALVAWRGATIALAWAKGNAGTAVAIVGGLLFSVSFLLMSRVFGDSGLQTLEGIVISFAPKARQLFARTGLSQ
ncbi:MAG: hypothetical protein ABI652_09130, partial [Acidobacteriota bacterium]